MGFPTVLVNKPHSNKMRMCNDVRKLNDKTILQSYPMLNMNYILADIGKRKCKKLSLIDLSDSYRQIPLTKRSQQIATMSTIIGDFSNRMYIRIEKSPICFHKIDGQNIFFNSRKIHGIFSWRYNNLFNNF